MFSKQNSLQALGIAHALGIVHAWGIVLGLVAGACFAPSSVAQDRVRGHVFLPPSSGATVLSTHMNAAANQALALGDLMESAAIARRINLESDRIAMENSVLWVETYFKRRQLNREYRDAERRDYQESKLLRAQQLHRNVEQGERYTDPTDRINFMMKRLLADSSAYRTIFLGDIPQLESASMRLSPDDISHILLSQTGGSEGARTIRPGDPGLVSDGWPKVFSQAEFEFERQAYDQIRTAMLKEIKQGELSLETMQAAQATLRLLEERFDEVYVWNDMKHVLDIATFTHCREVGEQFFRSQAASILRAFAMDNADMYSRDLQFQGDSLIDLLRHCSQHNLTFASPEPGDESTYTRLYQQLRQLYLEFVPHEPSS